MVLIKFNKDTMVIPKESQVNFLNKFTKIISIKWFFSGLDSINLDKAKKFMK